MPKVTFQEYQNGIYLSVLGVPFSFDGKPFEKMREARKTKAFLEKASFCGFDSKACPIFSFSCPENYKPSSNPVALNPKDSRGKDVQKAESKD